MKTEVESNPSAQQRRLLRRGRALFRADDLSGTLPLGIMQPLALRGSYHKLAFTSGLSEALFRSRETCGSGNLLLSPERMP